jgi:diamine N-acetyltransferase
MKHDYKCEGSRIILKSLEKGNIEKLRILRNQNKDWFINKDFITEENQIKWYENYLEKKNDFMFAIEIKDNPGEFVGAIAIYDIDLKKGCAEIGRTLVDSKLCGGKGIGCEATVLISDFGFSIIGVKTIIANVIAQNQKSIKMHENAGFKITYRYENGDCHLEVDKESLNYKELTKYYQ